MYLFLQGLGCRVLSVICKKSTLNHGGHSLIQGDSRFETKAFVTQSSTAVKVGTYSGHDISCLTP